MPNYCDFDGRIKAVDNPSISGTKKERMQKLIDWMNAEYHYAEGDPEIYCIKGEAKVPVEHHLGWRVFECNIDADAFENIPDDSDICLYFWGYCAWSVYSCMLEGPYTYYTDNHDDNVSKYGKDYSLTLCQAAKELGLEIEIFSSEPGMCFAEHYKVSSDGELIVNEETLYMEHYIEECNSYEDFAKSWTDEGKTCSASRESFEHAKSEGECFLVECEWLKDGEWPFALA